MERVYFAILGSPTGKARPRVTRYGTYTPEKTRAYEALVRLRFREVAPEWELLRGPVAVTIEAVFSAPPRCTKKQRAAILRGEEEPLKKPDIDNIAKIVLDALNGVAWVDDKQIVFLQVKKRYNSTIPGMESVHVQIGGEKDGEKWSDSNLHFTALLPEQSNE